MSPKVSLVIPAYNNAAYIADTMDSVLAQTFTDLEVIVADHSSTDETGAVLDRYATDPRVTVLTPTPAGGGAIANWNRVSEAATGEYIKLVCGDDLLVPQAVEKQVAALDDNPSAVLAAARRAIVDAHGTALIGARGLGPLTGHRRGPDAIRATVRAGTNLFGEPACVLMRRDRLEQTGWWGPAAYLLDEEAYVRVLLTGDFIGIGETLAAFRVSDSQWSVRLMREQAAQAADFHTELHRNHPEIVSGADRFIGNVNAMKTAAMRRAAYLYLRNRMNSAGRGKDKTR
jgi:glycosyltransferase involved in cell wall biosynthesis